jgi:hypothetical protein
MRPHQLRVEPFEPFALLFDAFPPSLARFRTSSGEAGGPFDAFGPFDALGMLFIL